MGVFACFEEFPDNFKIEFIKLGQDDVAGGSAA